MSVERKLLLVKLIGFLTGEISKNEIYEWALFVAVSRDYEELVKNDKLSEQIMQFLIDVNKPRTTTAPTQKILEYFIACLEDKKQFSEDDYKLLIADQPSKTATVPKSAVAAKKPLRIPVPVLSPGKRTLISRIANIYVFLFVSISIILNLTVILKPDFLVNPGEVAPIPDQVLRDAFPHLFYGITMIIALLVRGPRILFYALFFIATWGMLFYWYSITIFIFENKWPLYYLVMLSPALTLPPTLMFWIMLTRWFNVKEPA
ncbi:MAG: hypothetical protein IT395_05055 [Candidatus Omnitrophica bacterium]|nr:hypothetical protein [Candidatus Omnitrophota bacterium]